MHRHGFFLWVIIISSLLAGCHPNITPTNKSMFDSSLSSETIDRDVISQIQWANAWASKLKEAGMDPKFDDKASVFHVENSKCISELIGTLLATIEQRQWHDGNKIALLTDNLASINHDVITGNNNPLIHKYVLCRLAGVLEEYAQEILKQWANANYKKKIMARLHPRSRGIIDDIDFDIHSLSSGSQRTSEDIDRIISIAKVKLSAKDVNITDIKYKDGQPLLFEILYIINNQGIEDIFSHTEDFFFDDPAAHLGAEPHKRLWLTGVPLQFVYFPEIIWHYDSKSTTKMEGKINLANSKNDGKDNISKPENEFSVGDVTVSQNDILDKNLSFSFSNPICASIDWSFAFIYTPPKLVKYTPSKKKKDMIQYITCGWESLWPIDYYASYSIIVDPNDIQVRSPFTFCRIPDKPDVPIKMESRLKIDEIKGPCVFAVIAQEESQLVRPLGFLRFTRDDNNALYVEQLTTYPYSLPDKHGKSELQLTDHPATHLRLRLNNTATNLIK